MKTNKRNTMRFGMMILAAAFTLMLSINFVNAAQKGKMDAKTPPTKESILMGKKLYTTNCVPCHGESGKGDGVAGKFLPKKPANFQSDDFIKKSDEELFTVLTNGKGNMPAFKSVFSDKDRWNLINYIRTFSSK